MLIRNQTRTLNVPHEPGKTVVVRLLSGPQLDHAKEVAVERALETAKRLGTDFLRSIQEARAGAAPPAAPAEGAAKASDYDADTLVNSAFVSCSDGFLDKFENACDVLDPQTRDWLAREVEEMNVRPLAKSPASEG